MTNIPGRLVATVFAAVMIMAPLSSAADDMTAEQRKQVEEIVRDYIMQNPQLIQDALVKLEQQREERETAERAQTIKQRSATLFNSTRQAEVGNPNGDVVLVEFFDYNCGFCKRAMADLTKLLETDSNLRVVLKEFPVLGQNSVEAAQVSIAVQMQAPDKYLEFHSAMLNGRGRANKGRALMVAEQMGLDLDRLQADMKKSEVSATIEEVYALANSLGLTGTPSYVIGDEAVFGAVGYDELKKKIDDLRNCGSTVC